MDLCRAAAGAGLDFRREQTHPGADQVDEWQHQGAPGDSRRNLNALL